MTWPGNEAGQGEQCAYAQQFGVGKPEPDLATPPGSHFRYTELDSGAFTAYWALLKR